MVENFLWLKNHYLENMYKPKISIKHFWVQNFLWLQNHYLENMFNPKIFLTKIFGFKIFYGCKIITSKTG